MEATSGLALVGISEAIGTLTTQFTGEITNAAPVVVGAVILVAGVQLGLRWVKRLAGSIG